MKRWQVEGMSAALQAKCRAILTSMFEDAVQRGIIPENPAHGIKISKQVVREMRILTTEEYKRVLALVPEEYRLLVRLLVASGARWGEAAELRPADLQGDVLVLSRNVAEIKCPHRFVVTAISWWLADGMPLSTVRDRAGHWNISVTSRYIHAIDAAEDDALGRSAA